MPDLTLPFPANTPTVRRLRAAVLMSSMLVNSLGSAAADPGGVVALGERRELFVDHQLIDRMDGVSLRLHVPVSAGVAFGIDRPWEGPANFGHVVIQDQGRYLLYYRGMNLEPGDDTGLVCLAVSDDGVTWDKPALARHPLSGRDDANIVTTDTGAPLKGAVWHDTRPGIPANERIKALRGIPISGEEHTAFKDPKGPKRLELMVSADGLVFRPLEPERQPTFVSALPNSFDGGNTMFWSEAEERYVLYYRIMTDSGRRTMARTTSQDLRTWTEPVPMSYGDTPPEQFYVNNTTPYYRAPHIYIALAARFLEGRSAVTDEQAAAIGLKSPRGIIYNQDCSDGVLLTSRAGTESYQRTFMEALVRPGPGDGNWTSRTNYPLTGLFPDGPDRMMFFVNRRYLQDTWFIERLTMRTDGFISVNAPYAGGTMTTVPFTYSGDHLELNFATSGAGEIRVELQDLDGNPLPGFSLAECDPLIGDRIDRTVSWHGRKSLSGYIGRPVRLHFVMSDADLYAFRFAN
ncbi:MAG: hypothetical protein H7A44_07960 [Opitutaceae bacterium]|nr:hypothetical protein [Opitutaceae bacterium]